MAEKGTAARKWIPLQGFYFTIFLTAATSFTTTSVGIAIGLSTDDYTNELLLAVHYYAGPVQHSKYAEGRNRHTGITFQNYVRVFFFCLRPPTKIIIFP